MTCDRLTKCTKKKANSAHPGRDESKRNRKVHERLIQQAPKFYIPFKRNDARFWKKTEDVLKENLDNYDYYPFGVVSPFGIYRLQFTQDSFWYGVAIGCFFVILLVGLIVWTRQYNKPEDARDDFQVDMSAIGQMAVAGIAAICLFLFIWWMSAKGGIHTLYLDCQALVYEIYRDGRLRYRGHFHNIYVKLKCLQTVKDKRARVKSDLGMYYLELNGTRISPILLSSSSKNFHEMRKIGKRIAANFNLNFVDAEPVSKHHQIRHRCPYGVSPGDDEGLDSLFDAAEEWTEGLYETRSSVGPRSSLGPRGSMGPRRATHVGLKKMSLAVKNLGKSRSTKVFSRMRVTAEDQQSNTATTVA